MVNEGEEEKRGRGRNVPRLFFLDFIINFSTRKIIRRFFLPVRVVFIVVRGRGGGGEKKMETVASRAASFLPIVSGAMKCLIEKRSYWSSNTHTAISIALSTPKCIEITVSVVVMKFWGYNFKFCQTFHRIDKLLYLKIKCEKNFSENSLNLRSRKFSRILILSLS